MALIKRCPNCSFDNPADAFYCRNPIKDCGYPLGDVDVASDEAPLAKPPAPPRATEPARAPEPEPKPPVEPASAAPVCSQCGYDRNPPGTVDCLRCGMQLGPAPTAPTALAIRFPFGLFPLGATLRVGRDPDFSPLAGQLAGLAMVSRRHAELTVIENLVFVTDVGSMNGVKVNGESVAAGTRRPIRSGDEISFSSQLRGEIVAAETGR